jgi:hypothetical protein
MTNHINVVNYAIDCPVTNIGQLSKEEIRELNKAVKKGILWKGKNYEYPTPKTCWFGYEYGYPNIIPD